MGYKAPWYFYRYTNSYGGKNISNGKSKYVMKKYKDVWDYLRAYDSDEY